MMSPLKFYIFSYFIIFISCFSPKKTNFTHNEVLKRLDEMTIRNLDYNKKNSKFTYFKEKMVFEKPEKMRQLQQTTEFFIASRTYVGNFPLLIGLSPMTTGSTFMIIYEDQISSLGRIIYKIYNSAFTVIYTGNINGGLSWVTESAVAALSGNFMIIWSNYPYDGYYNFKVIHSDNTNSGNKSWGFGNYYGSYCTATSYGFLATHPEKISGGGFSLHSHLFDVNVNSLIDNIKNVYLAAGSSDYLLNFMGWQFDNSNFIHIYEYKAKVYIIYPDLIISNTLQIATAYTYACNPFLIVLGNYNFAVIYQYQTTLNTGYYVAGEVYNLNAVSRTITFVSSLSAVHSTPYMNVSSLPFASASSYIMPNGATGILIIQHISDYIQVGQVYALDGSKVGPEFLASNYLGNPGSTVGRMSRVQDLMNQSILSIWEYDQQKIYGRVVTPSLEISLTSSGLAPTLVINSFTSLQGQPIIVNSSNVLSSSIYTTNPSLLVYVISSSTNGNFELISAPGVSITTFTQQQINTNQVTLVNDNIQTSVSFQLQTELSGVYSVIYVGIVKFYGPPYITINNIIINQGQTGFLTAAMLTTIAFNCPNLAWIVYTVSGISSNIYFQFTSASGVPITSFSQLDINNERVEIIHDNSTLLVPAFTIQVQFVEFFIIGTNALVTFNSLAATIQNSFIIKQGIMLTITNSMLNSVLSPISNINTITYSIKSVTNGNFALLSSPKLAIVSFTQDQIDSNSIIFIPDGTTNEPSFIFQTTTVSGSSYPLNGIINFFSISITNNDLIINQGETISITSTMLQSTVSNSFDFSLIIYSILSTTNIFIQYQINQGVQITTFSQADINNNNIQMVHDNSSTTPTMVFVVKFQDISSSPTNALFTFYSLPIVINNFFSMYPGETLTVMPQMLQSVVANCPNETWIIYTISQVSNIYFQLTTSKGIPIDTFTQADINSNKVQIVHDNSNEKPIFVFKVKFLSMFNWPCFGNIIFSNPIIMADGSIISLNRVYQIEFNKNWECLLSNFTAYLTITFTGIDAKYYEYVIVNASNETFFAFFFYFHFLIEKFPEPCNLTIGININSTNSDNKFFLLNKTVHFDIYNTCLTNYFITINSNVFIFLFILIL